MASYKFGAFVLDPESRHLLRDGEPVTMAGKVLDTLVVLVQNHGRVLGKEELLSRLWPDTVVEDANLTQSIFTLRKVLGDSPKSPRFIATVSGRGYQFVAPIIEVASPLNLADISSETAVSPAAGRFPVLWAGTAVCAAFIALVAIWFWTNGRAQDATGQPSQPEPFTSLLGWAQSPAFSPDGNEIAYVWAQENEGDQSIYLKLVGTGTELRLTAPPGRDCSPRWSPDGRYIAFYRTTPGATGYYIVSAIGGPARQIFRTDSDKGGGLDWFADGKHVVIAEGDATASGAQPSWQGAHPMRLVSVDIETARQTVLTTPPTGTIGDAEPAFSPDGKKLAFMRIAADGVADIYVLGVNGDRPRRLTGYGAVIGGIAWTSNSREVVFSLALDGGARLWRIPAGGGVARPFTSSTENVYEPSIARHGNRLAYVVGAQNENLWQIDLAGLNSPATAALPTRVVYSSRSQRNPMYSPDGRKLAFNSNRTGPDEIWVSDADGRNPVQLTRCRTFSGSPRWSPDGSFIAFDSRMNGNPEIYVVPAQGGPPEGGRVWRITNNPAEDVVPSWSSDGKWIYFSSNRNGEFQIWKVPAATGESARTPAVQVTQGGGFGAFETADGQYLYFAKGRGKPGLWRRPLKGDRGSREEPVMTQLQYWGLWALSSRGIYFLDLPASPQEKVRLKFFDLQSKNTADVSTLNKPVNRWDPAVTLSPDGRHLIYEQVDSGGSNIAIVDNFH